MVTGLANFFLCIGSGTSLEGCGSLWRQCGNGKRSCFLYIVRRSPQFLFEDGFLSRCHDEHAPSCSISSSLFTLLLYFFFRRPSYDLSRIGLFNGNERNT